MTENITKIIIVRKSASVTNSWETETTPFNLEREIAYSIMPPTLTPNWLGSE
jgi:hypothetical protein